jgi:hypothetical protein
MADESRAKVMVLGRTATAFAMLCATAGPTIAQVRAFHPGGDDGEAPGPVVKGECLRDA